MCMRVLAVQCVSFKNSVEIEVYNIIITLLCLLPWLCRRMFPPVIVSVKGLEPDSLYSISLSMLPVDEYRYRYRKGDGWAKVGKGARQCSLQTFTHPDSRNLGSHWMRQPISFKTLKLTNNTTSIESNQVSHNRYFIE